MLSWIDFYTTSSLKQQFADKHVAPIGHIILNPSQPVFLLNAVCLATNTNFIVVVGMT
jgi:hypothetical protein